MRLDAKCYWRWPYIRLSYKKTSDILRELVRSYNAAPATRFCCSFAAPT